jgi:hypothetical protein
MSEVVNDPYACSACLARKDEKRCPDSGAIIPAGWDHC